jgi:hypothetical protein
LCDCIFLEMSHVGCVCCHCVFCPRRKGCLLPLVVILWRFQHVASSVNVPLCLGVPTTLYDSCQVILSATHILTPSQSLWVPAMHMQLQIHVGEAPRDSSRDASLDTLTPGSRFLASSSLFENDIVQRRRSQHTRTLTPMNTRTQTLPL